TPSSGPPGVNEASRHEHVSTPYVEARGEPGDLVVRPTTPLDTVISVPVKESVAGPREPCGELDRRLTLARDALMGVERIDMDEHVPWVGSRKLRRAVDSRHPVCLDNSRIEASSGSSQSRGALGGDIAEEAGCALAESLQSERGRPGVDVRRCPDRLEVRAATEVWIARGARKESKSAMKSRRALGQRVRG